MYTFTTQASDTEQNRRGGRLAAGVYHANVLNAVQRATRNGDKQMVDLTLQVEGAGQPVELHEYLVLSSATSWKIEQYLASAGHRFKAGETIEFDPAACVGEHVVIETFNERGDKGGLFPRVAKFVQANCQRDVPRAGFVFGAEDLASRGLDSEGCSTATSSQGGARATSNRDGARGAVAGYGSAAAPRTAAPASAGYPSTPRGGYAEAGPSTPRGGVAGARPAGPGIDDLLPHADDDDIPF